MNDTDSTTAEIAPDEAPSDEPSDARTTMERAEGDRLFADAKRFREVAELVHARRDLGGVDSAVLAERSLSILLRLLARLHGGEAPSDFAALVELGGAIAAAESLLAEDLRPDLAIIHEMRERVYQGSEVTPAEVRKYDRAFLRCQEWFRAAEEYLDQKLPARKVRFVRLLAVTAPALVAFTVGLAIGRHVHPEAPAPGTTVQPAPGAVTTGPGFAGTFFRDPEFHDVALSRTDSAISFNWEAEPPAQDMPADNFSIRWEARLNVTESGKYRFYLVSDDGSRFMLDGAQVVDNWGSHATVTKVGDILLEKGVHPIRVEFFDHIGNALIRLEWSSEFFERRLITSRDLK